MFDAIPGLGSIPALLYTMHQSADGQLTLQQANAALRDLYGLDPATADAQTMEAAVHPDDRPRLDATRLAATAAHAPICIEYRILHPVRGEVWIEERAAPTPAPDGGLDWSGLRLDIDARKRPEAERDLKAAAFDRADQSFFLLDAHTGQVLYTNPAACRALGYSPEELKRLTPFDFDPDLTPEALAGFMEQIDAEGRVTFETRHRHRDGHTFPVEIMSTRFDHRGCATFLSVAVDISRRRAALEALACSERDYRTLVENAPGNLIRYDREGRIRYLNPQLERVLGRTTAELDGLRPGEAWPDGLYAPIEAALGRVLAGGPGESFEMTYLDACLGPAMCSLHIAAERDADGAVCGAVAFSLDITEHKRMEAELRAREEELRALADHSPDTVARYDPEARLVYLNPNLERILGRTLAEVRGRTPTEAGLLEGAFFEAWVREVAASGQARVFEHPVETVGGVFWGQVHLVPELDEAGRATHVQVVTRDITALKAVQHQLERSRTELRELAARHDRDQEDQRKHLAWDVHEGVGQQLAALRMQLLALRAGGDAALRERIGGMLALVDQGIAQVRRVTAALRPRVLDLGLPAALEWLCEAFAERTGVSCDADVPSGPVELDEATAVALYRVAEEGLDNVARHAWAEWAALKLERIEGHYRLELRDDGRGFDLAQARAGATVGLAWMEERIAALGGELRVASTPGRGTVVEVRVGSLA